MQAIVTGAGGFIGSHLVKYLREKDYWVKGIDIKYPEFEPTSANEFMIQDLRKPCPELFDIKEVYHLAADMGGIGYIEKNRADILYNNLMINMNVLKSCKEMKVNNLLFTSSACVYPTYLQTDPNAKPLEEECAYPSEPEEGYGEEKLIMEKACKYFREDHKIKTHIVRLHNIYGEKGTYEGGKEKSPAALCRKIALAKDGDEIEIWGDGTQTRSYCYVSDCVEALHRLMLSDYYEPLNIGTDRLVSINDLCDTIANIAGKLIRKDYNMLSPQGVTGRNADISKARKILKWAPQVSLEWGLRSLYEWIEKRV